MIFHFCYWPSGCPGGRSPGNRLYLQDWEEEPPITATVVLLFTLSGPIYALSASFQPAVLFYVSWINKNNVKQH